MNSFYEPLITKEELARRLDVSRSCVDKWIRQRRIPVYSLGTRCVRFDYSEVRQSLAKFERGALKRFPRETYQPRKRKKAFRASQLMLPFETRDPAQETFDFMKNLGRRPLISPN